MKTVIGIPDARHLILPKLYDGDEKKQKKIVQIRVAEGVKRLYIAILLESLISATGTDVVPIKMQDSRKYRKIEEDGSVSLLPHYNNLWLRDLGLVVESETGQSRFYYPSVKQGQYDDDCPNEPSPFSEERIKEIKLYFKVTSRKPLKESLPSYIDLVALTPREMMYFEGGNVELIFVNEVGYLLYNNHNQGLPGNLGAEKVGKSLATILGSELNKTIKLVMLNLNKQVIQKDYYHLDIYFHRLPDGRFLLMEGVLSQESEKELQEILAENLIIVPKDLKFSHINFLSFTAVDKTKYIIDIDRNFTEGQRAYLTKLGFKLIDLNTITRDSQAFDEEFFDLFVARLPQELRARTQACGEFRCTEEELLKYLQVSCMELAEDGTVSTKPVLEKSDLGYQPSVQPLEYDDIQTYFKTKGGKTHCVTLNFQVSGATATQLQRGRDITV